MQRGGASDKTDVLDITLSGQGRISVSQADWRNSECGEGK
ncbi:hypothetical protein HMPREF0758_4387 [Serratia odorifera DSM 4582]|uniref:Uncharacterized protein n=1 Tax=Serratia odorifera DSM 4582 TaxID=667129 RepID=D4E887_SEROD|nr:hypothetical protein HMPREF0758_4387 [Serratia odorifera DSM 4582]